MFFLINTHFLIYRKEKGFFEKLDSHLIFKSFKIFLIAFKMSKE